jgi:hypothetical protein
LMTAWHYVNDRKLQEAKSSILFLNSPKSQGPNNDVFRRDALMLTSSK